MRLLDDWTSRLLVLGLERLSLMSNLFETLLNCELFSCKSTVFSNSGCHVAFGLANSDATVASVLLSLLHDLRFHDEHPVLLALVVVKNELLTICVTIGKHQN